MIPDGVFLNLHPDIYREDPALGSTDHKEMLTGICQWHGKRRNKSLSEALELNVEKDPQKAAKKTAGKEYGSALDVMLLDGVEAFDAAYVDDPEPPEDMPTTKEEMGAALRSKGIVPPNMSAKKDEFLRMCRVVGIVTAAEWAEERSLLLMGRKPISKQWRRVITLTKAIMDRHSGAQRYIQGGRAQVSVFWTDPTGLRLKARFDYLHPHVTVDLKTFAGRDGEDAVTAFVSQAQRFAYDLQAAHYHEARAEALPALVAAGRVFASAISDGDGGLTFFASDMQDHLFMEKVAAYEKPRWAWLTVMTGGVPEIDTIEMPTDLLQFSAARVQVENARQNYRDFRAKFGPSDDEIWLADRGHVVLTDQMFYQRSANRGAIMWETA